MLWPLAALLAGGWIAAAQDPPRLEVTPAEVQVSGAGGTGTVAVRSNVSWHTSSNASWIVVSPADGTGDGTVTYTVEPNPNTTPRNGDFMVDVPNLLHYIVVHQEARGVLAIDPGLVTLPKEGGSASIAVTATGPWTATASDLWITITSGASGNGNGTVQFRVPANTGGWRDGSIHFSETSLYTRVEQNEAEGGGGGGGNQLTVTPDPLIVPPEGGEFTVQVHATGAWTATPEPDHVVMDAVTHTGDGELTFTVRPNLNNGDLRIGALNINGSWMPQILQGKLADVTLSPSEVRIPYNTSASGTIHVAASGFWFADNSRAPWIKIGSGGSGNGDGDISWSVSADAFRLGIQNDVLKVNRQPLGFWLEGPRCGWRLIPLNLTAPPGGGAVTAQVISDPDPCPWSARDFPDWVTVTPASGVGAATVTFIAAPNPGDARVANIPLTDNPTHPVMHLTQLKNCPATVTPATLEVGSEAVAGSLAIQTAADCPWGVVADATWVTWDGPTSGTGPGTARYLVAVNGSTQGRGTAIHAAGNTIPVRQAGAPCATALSAPGSMLPAAGGSARLNLTAPQQDCAWTASSSQPWATLTPASGSGSSSITVTASANPAPATRPVVISAGGRETTLTQAGIVCNFTVSPTTMQVEAGSSSAIWAWVWVSTGPTCPWQASASFPWITFLNGGSATGNSSLDFRVAPNDSGSARTGVINVGGQTITVQQAGAACTYRLHPDPILSFGTAGGQISVPVTADRPGCPGPFEVMPTVSWLRGSYSWSSTGGSVLVTASPSAGAGPRYGRVLVLPSESVSLYVAQNSTATAAFTVTPNTVFDDGTGGTYTLQITSADPSFGPVVQEYFKIPTWAHVTGGGCCGSWPYSVTLDPFPGQVGISQLREATIIVGERTVYIKQQSK